MLRHPDYTRSRVGQLTDRFRGRIYSKTHPLVSVEVSPRVDRIPYHEAIKLPFRPVKLGEQFGPLFATYWFRVRVEVPQDWKGGRVDLLWDTHSENTLWIDGRSIEGLNTANNYGRMDAVLIDKARGGEAFEIYLEMACNDAFGHHGKQWPEHRSPIFLDRAELGLFDPLAWEIYHDLRALVDLEKEQVPGAAKEWTFSGSSVPGDLDKTWAGKLLFELNRFANEIDESDRDTWQRAHPILKDLLATRNGDCVHELSAIGHAHIDTAWLWPLAETWRKCTRTFSTQTRYMEEYPEYRFACSQAYQYWIVRDQNPDLYERIKKAAKKGQWVPVGGTWIEPDCNIPSGESLIRQFLFGQRFFEREFGRRCNEFWNPDVFGYNGQLPQIMRQAGIGRFLTQKLSWNWFNKPMHHTFHWQGIDGSEVLAHFPPADTYNAVCTVSEIRRHARNYKDNDRSREAMYLFGYGDGGGGPTKAMLESLSRLKDLQGVPRCTMRTSDEFFDRLEKDAKDLPTVVGELYFELHRGTYTTQARTKRGNRKSEFLLHDIEFLAGVAARLSPAAAYPRDAVNGLWQIVLLNQFHDILPGSSIRQVYEDAEAQYAEVETKGATLREQAANALIQALSGEPAPPGAAGGAATRWTPINTIGFDRAEVTQQPDGKLVLVEAPSCGIGRVSTGLASGSVEVREEGDRVVLENAQLTAVLAKTGELLSLVHNASNRESLAAGAAGNVLELSDDKPTNWEAWDVDPWIAETEKPVGPAASCKITRRDPLRAEVTFERSIGASSRMTQVVRLDANASRLEFHCDVDWRERQKMLKVAFPLAVRSLTATYEMQFGAVERPTHANNSIALAQYEVPGHKWADLSEHGFGVALLSESKYGFSCRGSVLRMSLLRGTTSPDPEADLGRHTFSYALYPHEGRWQEGGVVAESYRFNAPILWAPAGAGGGARSFFSTEDPNLVIDTVKRAEDDDALVVRLYECHGGRGKAPVKIGVPVKAAVRCNALEDDGDPVPVRDGVVELTYGPYEIISLKLR